MPLVTEITRNGERRSVPWSWSHVQAMAATIIAEEALPMETAILTALSHVPHTARFRHVFESDDPQGEAFVIEPGDVLNAWREVR